MEINFDFKIVPFRYSKGVPLEQSFCAILQLRTEEQKGFSFQSLTHNLSKFKKTPLLIAIGSF